ncbi:MAG: hypothetical protein ACK5LC_03220, partial [Coprobacillaceae bacterium]
MLIDSDYFKEYMEYDIPQFNKWYSIAVSDIKYIYPCYSEDLSDSDLLTLKNAICIQMDYLFTNQDAIKGIASFSVGKFSVTRSSNNNGKPVGRYSNETYLMLKDVFKECSSQWISKGA